jgi:hypothetical protein
LIKQTLSFSVAMGRGLPEQVRLILDLEKVAFSVPSKAFR